MIEREIEREIKERERDNVIKMERDNVIERESV